MADAVVAVGREKLAEVLAQWPASDEASWAVCFISSAPTAGELAAIREAAKLCDRVVAMRLVKDPVAVPRLAETVRGTGADVLWLPGEGGGRLKVSVDGEKMDEWTMTALAQGLVTVLPNLVVVPRGNLAVVRALRAVQAAWGEFFTLRTVV